MSLVHVKLKNGEDLLGYLESTTDHDIEINSPVSINIDPNLGFFAKSWMLLTAVNTVRIKNTDLLFCLSASEKAERYYEEFMHRVSDSEDKSELGMDFDHDLENIFSAMVEAKSSTKH